MPRRKNLEKISASAEDGARGGQPERIHPRRQGATFPKCPVRGRSQKWAVSLRSERVKHPADRLMQNQKVAGYPNLKVTLRSKTCARRGESQFRAGHYPRVSGEFAPSSPAPFYWGSEGRVFKSRRPDLLSSLTT